MLATSFDIQLPAWVTEEVAHAGALPDLAERMALVIKLSAMNVSQGTGGPFAAAVFDREHATVLSVGVNLVVASGYSCAHAELVALTLAQQKTGSFDLGSSAHYELLSSAEPCTMCLGAIVWSGVEHMACAARGTDVEAIGFDEGPKPADWAEALRQRGIDVSVDVARAAARQVLDKYRAAGGAIYNAKRQAKR